MADQTPEGTPAGRGSTPERDALSVALDAIDDRWSLHVVRAVAFGAHRFTDILREVGAPRDVLAARLRKLVETGVLEPRSPERGRMAGYALTAKGQDLGSVVLVLKRWGEAHGTGATPRFEIVHDPCGAQLVADVTCGACGRVVRSEDLSHPGSPPPPA